MDDFWQDSGYRLLARQDNGHLAVTPDFLRAYFLRPEVRPVEESCPAELALHESLLQDPERPVTEAEIEAMADPDARDNYRVVLAFRDRLSRAETLEACYLAAFLEGGGVDLPPLFIDQMAHVIVRSVLEGCDDGLRARAGELWFREQQVMIHEGNILAADLETVEMYAKTGGFGTLGQLVAQAQTPLRSVELDVLDRPNAELYWTRSDKFDTALNLSFAAEGLDALARLLEAWIAHFLAVDVQIQPVQKISDKRWVWHVGLDAEGSRLLNDLYNGADVGEERLTHLLSLFRLDFKDPSVMRADIAGRAVYLALCKTPEDRLRLKPQNLLVNLPLAERA